MKRLLLPFWLLSVLVWGVPGWTMPTHETEAGPSPNLSPPQETWRPFAPPMSRFSVLLPSLPKSKIIETLDGSEIYQFLSIGGENRYIIQYTDRPTENIRILGPEKILAFAIDAFIKGHPGMAFDKHHINLGACQGEEVVAALPHHRQEIFRAYLSNGRMYQVIAIGPAADAEAETERARFLNSFTLIPAKPLEGSLKTP